MCLKNPLVKNNRSAKYLCSNFGHFLFFTRIVADPLFDQQIHIQKLEKELQQKMHMQQDYDKLQTSYVASTRKYETLFQEHSILSERYHQLEKIANQQRAQLQDERQEKQVLEKNVIILTEKVALIGKNLQQTEDKLEALRQEKLFLIQEKTELQKLKKIV